jgi:hypothetical protein
MAPLIAGWLIHNKGLALGFRAACICATITMLASAFVLLFFLKETLERSFGIRRSILANLSFRSHLWRHSLSSNHLALLLSYGLIAFANGLVGQYYILYALGNIGLSPIEWAPIAALQSLVIAFKIPRG